MNFDVMKQAVTKQFDKMTRAEGGLFRTGIDKDTMWATYLDSFPPGTNNIFRERREHDCSCCKQFIRTVGDVVAVVGGRLVSVWDVPHLVGEDSDAGYLMVARAMATLVKSQPIRDVFLHYERSVGTDKNYEYDKAAAAGTGLVAEPVRTWTHFHVELPRSNAPGHDCLCDKKVLDTRLGELRTAHDVMTRGLTELTRDAVDSVLDIIRQDSLYRGREYLGAVEAFSALMAQHDAVPSAMRDNFVWSRVRDASAVGRIRNTAIGTLLIDLSAGVDLESAVRKFETSIMAPANFKRSTALVTEAMVQRARDQVDGLGLTDALYRRHARMSDIAINDVLFADRSARKSMRGDAFSEVATKRTVPKIDGSATGVPIEDFIASVLPHASSMDITFENRHAGNLFSLIAPAVARSPRLLRWDNGFSWAYAGDVTDSIKERVKQAGGNVTGDLCCRLAWYNHDDLDFHMVETGRPLYRHEIFFGTRGLRSPSGGQLDVDMNAGRGTTRTPVENIFYKSRATMREGTYHLYVHQYMRRETDNVGFEVEIDWLGNVVNYSYDRAMRTGEKVSVAEFTYSKSGGIMITKWLLPPATASRKVWGLQTQGWQRVNLLMRSPNHWEGEAGGGNRHYFFVLDGCVNETQPRGFFNEFLRPELHEHRKVLEMVGAKMKVEASAEQLSGLGFSDTQRAELLVKVVIGEATRTYRVLV